MYKLRDIKWSCHHISPHRRSAESGIKIDYIFLMFFTSEAVFQRFVEKYEYIILWISNDAGNRIAPATASLLNMLINVIRRDSFQKLTKESPVSKKYSFQFHSFHDLSKNVLPPIHYCCHLSTEKDFPESTGCKKETLGH